MKVLKFGGSSLAAPERLKRVIDVVCQSAHHERTGLVVSAVGGVTNLLVAAIDAAVRGVTTDDIEHQIQHKHEALMRFPEFQLAGKALEQLLAHHEDLYQQLRRDLDGIRLLKTCPNEVRARVLSTGERLSVQLVYALLSQRSLHVLLQDPTLLIPCSGNVLEAQPNLAELRKRGAELLKQTFDVALMPGFFAGHKQHAIALLGRNGSDYSGALLAYAVQASACEIWTDVDGVFTADPRLVSSAKVLPSLSFEEALELCHFGAKVLHPKTIGPLAEIGIPIFIRNTLNPDAPGTRIDRSSVIPQSSARGLTLL